MQTDPKKLLRNRMAVEKAPFPETSEVKKGCLPRTASWAKLSRPAVAALDRWRVRIVV